MNSNTYKKIDLIGTSESSIEDAVNNAISASEQSLRNLKWFELNEIRGSIAGGKVEQWQVGIKLAFAIDSESGGVSIENLQVDEDAFEKPSPTRLDDSMGSRPIGSA